MAKFKNIVVAENDSKLVLFPRKKDEGMRVELSPEMSAKIRKTVNAYVKADSRDLPYSDLLKADRRVSMMNGNPLAKQIKGMLSSKPAPKAELSIEDAMAEAEARDEVMSKAAAIKRSNMSAENKAMLLSMIGA